MRIRRLALVPMLPALSGCGLFDAPVLPDDVVKSDDDAIRLARANCSPGPNDRDDWGASRDGDVWNVWWSHRQSSVSVQIRKSDGEFEDCQVNLVPN